jgi:hypothetical protein
MRISNPFYLDINLPWFGRGLCVSGPGDMKVRIGSCIVPLHRNVEQNFFGCIGNFPT